MTRSFFSALASLALLAACGPATPVASPLDERPRIVRASDGVELDFDAFIDALAVHRVIYVGERHDQARDHRLEAAIADAILERDPSLALGFEMFQRPAQPHLDAYVAGSIEESELLTRAEWETRWGYDFAAYRPLVSIGARHQRPLLALNAPQEITRTVARQGLDALTDEQRAELPELDLEVAAHRERVNAALAGHPHGTPELLERFYLAQVIWDETMADTVARYLAREDAAHHLMVFAGVMHVMRDAIPERAGRRTPNDHVIVMPVESDEELAEAREQIDFAVIDP
ncbi:MAG: ChaN family lipoprotein [Sandaracinaceae bacterium]